MYTVIIIHAPILGNYSASNVLCYVRSRKAADKMVRELSAKNAGNGYVAGYMFCEGKLASTISQIS